MRFILCAFALLMVLMAQIGCGSGVSNQNSSVSPGNSSFPFTGVYNFRDSKNCDQSLIISQFHLIQRQDNSITLVVLQGNSSSPTGTEYSGFLDSNNGIEFANFESSLGCSATLIQDDQEAINVSHGSGLQAQVGDLVVDCGSTATSTGCLADYQKQSNN